MGCFWSKTNRGESCWTSGMVVKIHILSTVLLWRLCLEKRKIRAKQARAMSGSNLSSFCAHVHAVLSLQHVELSFVGVLYCGPCGGGCFLCCLKSPHATWQMFTVADLNTLHLFSFQASVHVPQQQQQQGGVDAGGFEQWVIWPSRPTDWGKTSLKSSHQLCCTIPLNILTLYCRRGQEEVVLEPIINMYETVLGI